MSLLLLLQSSAGAPTGAQLDTSTSGEDSGGSLSIPITIGNNSNRLLVVSISVQDSNHANLPITSVTLGGQSFSRAIFKESTNNVRAEIWYLLAPTVGAGTIEITATGSVWMGAVASSWHNMVQSDQPNANGTNIGSSSTPSVDITTTLPDALLIDALSSEAARSEVGTDQASLGIDQGQSFENVAASYKIKSDSGDDTMSNVLSSAQAWAMVVTAFLPISTGDEAPTVETTDPVVSITANAATAGGNVVSDGGDTITERGVVISTSANPTITNTKFTDSGTMGEFTVRLTSLSPNTTYHIRAYATNGQGTSYGADVTFVTRKFSVQKHYFYKIYNSGGYVETWTKEVISEPTFRTSINNGPGELTIELARPFDEFGEDVDVKLNNKVEVYVVDQEAPNGSLIYSGYISGYKPIVREAREWVEVTVFGFAAELARMVLRDSSGNTTLTYNSFDPSNILKDVINKLRSLGCSLNYTASSIDLTNTVVSYTFNTNTGKECIDKIVELCPVGWYFRVDPDGTVYLKPRHVVADHSFALGLEVENLETFRRLEDLVNRVLFTGGGDPPLFRKYENTGSQDSYGLHERKVVDQRVTVAATAAILSNRIIDSQKDPEIRSKFTIVDSNGPGSRGYDIESIKPGQTLKVKNLKTDIRTVSYWDVALWDVDVWDQTIQTSAADVIQILSVEYNPDSLVIEASSRLPQIAKRVEDINRNLENTQTVNNPSAPS